MKTILVTGGCGFIGSHTTYTLIEKGYRVIIIDSNINSSKKTIYRIQNLLKENKISIQKLQFIHGDVRDESLLAKIFLEAKNDNQPIESVIHFAGLKSVEESIINPIRYWDANLYGTITLIKVMYKNNCNNLIFSSSASIYSENNKFPVSEDGYIAPSSPYGNTKFAIENMLFDSFKSKHQRLKIAVLRYFNPIGAHHSGFLGEDYGGEKTNIFPVILKVASKLQSKLLINGNNWDTKDGTCVRDYVHVMDVAEGHIKVLEYLLVSNVKEFLKLNIGTGKGTSVLELINTFEKVNNLKIPYTFSRRREGDNALSIADNSLIMKKIKWNPKRNLETMCKDGWNWWLNSGNKI